ncbi:MAG: Fur family transcriptional regulator [Candidatus Eisenbacteria bacterium]
MTDAVVQRLREKGLRVTRQRQVVYSLLREIGGHHSADEILAILVDRGEDIHRQSVYNVVGDLQQVGLVMCADAGPGRALYEASDHWHHHFVCRVCQVVLDVPCIEGSKPCLEIPEGVASVIDEAQVIFRGVCHGCAGTETAGTMATGTGATGTQN